MTNHFRAPGAGRFVSAALVMGVAFVVFGASFGVLAVSAGASPAQAFVMSLLVFTGASQLSAVSVLAAGGSAASAMGGAVLLAGRNAVYGLALSPLLQGGRWSRFVGTQWVIDETTAVVTAEEGDETRRTAFWVTAPILYATWCLGTLGGALVGNSLDPKAFGLDVAAPVMFTAMIVPHLRTRNGRRAAAFGAVSAVCLVPFLPVGLPVLVAAFGMFFGLSPDAPGKADSRTLDGMP